MQEGTDNTSPKHTFPFKYQGNGHIYISKKAEPFAKFICSWIASVQDCYVLHPTPMKIPSKIFHQDNSFPMLHEIDEGARIF